MEEEEKEKKDEKEEKEEEEVKKEEALNDVISLSSQDIWVIRLYVRAPMGDGKAERGNFARGDRGILHIFPRAVYFFAGLACPAKCIRIFCPLGAGGGSSRIYLTTQQFKTFLLVMEGKICALCFITYRHDIIDVA